MMVMCQCGKSNKTTLFPVKSRNIFSVAGISGIPGLRGKQSKMSKIAPNSASGTFFKYIGIPSYDEPNQY